MVTQQSKIGYVYVVLPTYNERENLCLIVSALLDLAVPNLKVLVVDDASPDGTGELADELSSQYTGHVEVLHRPAKQGLGTAYSQGFALALERGADYVIQMDADFSHPPEIIPQMLAALADYDVVIASRYTRGGSTDPNWPVRRKLISRMANLYARIVMRLPISDVTGGYKAFRRQVLVALDLSSLHSTGFSFQVEVNFLCHQLGFRLVEVPFVFHERRWGTSKLGPSIVFEGLWKLWQLKLRYRSLRRQVDSTVENQSAIGLRQ